jgi:hypothetical protein
MLVDLTDLSAITQMLLDEHLQSQQKFALLQAFTDANSAFYWIL